MRLPPRALVLALLAGCAAPEVVPAPEPAPPPAAGEVLRGAEMARVRCLVVAPFENASDDPLAAEAATSALLSGLDPARVRALPVSELRGLFRETTYELPEGIGPSLALELGQLLGADGVLYGAVEGRAAAPGSPLVVTVRLATPGEHELLFATAATVERRPDEDAPAAVRRVASAAASPMLKRLGTSGRRSCFDRERQARLRALALAEARPAQPAPPRAAAASPTSAPPVAAQPTVAPPASGPPSAVATSAAPVAPAAAPAAKKARTPRQADWTKRLARRGRLVVEDVAFKGRTAELENEAGLADLVLAILATPGLKVRIEGFVDATSDPGNDARLSMSMAQAAGQRLVELGVPSGRVSWAGRGGDSPLLPNFTARGRSANRRLEAVGLR